MLPSRGLICSVAIISLAKSLQLYSIQLLLFKAKYWQKDCTKITAWPVHPYLPAHTMIPDTRCSRTIVSRMSLLFCYITCDNNRDHVKHTSVHNSAYVPSLLRMGGSLWTPGQVLRSTSDRSVQSRTDSKGGKQVGSSVGYELENQISAGSSQLTAQSVAHYHNKLAVYSPTANTVTCASNSSWIFAP